MGRMSTMSFQAPLIGTDIFPKQPVAITSGMKVCMLQSQHCFK